MTEPAPLRCEARGRQTCGRSSFRRIRSCSKARGAAGRPTRGRRSFASWCGRWRLLIAARRRPTCRRRDEQVTTPLGRGAEPGPDRCRRDRAGPPRRAGDGRGHPRADARKPRSGTSGSFATRRPCARPSTTTSSRRGRGSRWPWWSTRCSPPAARRSGPARSSRPPACPGSSCSR